MDPSGYVENEKENIEIGRWSVNNEKGSPSWSHTKSIDVNVTTYLFLSKPIVVQGLRFSFVLLFGNESFSCMEAMIIELKY